MAPAQTERTPFADLDAQPRAMTTMLLAALEAMGHHPEIRRVRRVAFDLLRPAPGERLLDAGAGAGEVARWLAGAVGAGETGVGEVGPGAARAGEVIALDVSAAMTEAARLRHDGSPVRYLTGDVGATMLDDDVIDGVWCERVLQHVPDPDAAITELVRVTRPGGRICLIDTDWSSLAFDGIPERLSETVTADMRSRFAPGQSVIGRTLRRRLVGAGLTDVTAVPVTCLFGDPASAAVVLPMVNPRVPAEAWLSAVDVRREWFDRVEEAGRRGDFLAVLTIWVVAGTVAPQPARR